MMKRTIIVLATILVALSIACGKQGAPPPDKPPAVEQSQITGLRLGASADTKAVCDLVRTNYLNDKLFTADAKTAINIAMTVNHKAVDPNVKSAVEAMYQAASGAPRNRAVEVTIKTCRDAGWHE